MRSTSVPITPSRLEPILRPINAFISAESSGGLLLLIAAIAAMAWANSPWAHTYHDFWHTKLSVGVGKFSYALSLEHWVNDGLMVIFFLLVGLEIKRELLVGELASMRRAALPVAAAIGGMVVPALIYAMFNRTGPGAAGWGVPMATDIAFAVGVLTLVGRSLPTSVKVFLLAIAIVDDLGAVLVIALFYTNDISMMALACAGGFLVALILLNVLRVHRPTPYIVLGVGLWAATLASGIHATIAGVLLAFTIPASRQLDNESSYVAYMREMLADFERDIDRVPDVITDHQGHALTAMETASKAVQTPLAEVEHALLRPVTVLIIPVFALANAGVDIRTGGIAALSNPVTWGVMLGLLLGKPIGVLLASWIVLKARIAAMPNGGSWRQLIGIAVLCGIGFTMSLFVATLAFSDQPNLLAASKVGILLGSLASGTIGGLLVASAAKRRAPSPNRAEQ